MMWKFIVQLSITSFMVAVMLGVSAVGRFILVSLIIGLSFGLGYAEGRDDAIRKL